MKVKLNAKTASPAKIYHFTLKIVLESMEQDGRINFVLRIRIFYKEDFAFTFGQCKSTTSNDCYVVLHTITYMYQCLHTLICLCTSIRFKGFFTLSDIKGEGNIALH